MTALPGIPPGTVLQLAPGEWCDEATRLPVWRRTDILVEHVQRDTADDRNVWVTGHAIECGYDTSDCTVPCMTLLVRVAAILRQISR